MSVTETQAECERAYTLREAAGILGVSVTALRRRIVAGQVRAERVERPQGSAWRVYVSETRSTVECDSDNAPPHAPPAERADPAGLVAMAAVIDRLTVENRQLAEAATLWMERARVLADQLALAAPHAPDSPGAPHPAPGSPDPPPAPPQPFPSPLPPTPNVRALTPWLLLVAILCVAVVVGWPPGLPR